MTFKTLIESFVGALNTYVVPVIVALIFVFFLWGVARYFFIEDSDQARVKGRQHMLWGVIAIGVLVALWGIVNLLLSTLNLPSA